MKPDRATTWHEGNTEGNYLLNFLENLKLAFSESQFREVRDGVVWPHPRSKYSFRNYNNYGQDRNPLEIVFSTPLFFVDLL